MDLNRDEFYRAIDGLKGDLREDLREIHDQLKTVNGRVGKSEIGLENNRTRITSLEKVVFHRRRGDYAGGGEEWASAFSKREYALMSLGFAMVWAVIKLVEFMGTKMWAALTTGAVK